MNVNDPLLNLASVLLAGIVGGELFGMLRLPKVTGWIGTGIILRALGVPGLEPENLGRFSPFTNFVLGYIAFTVGATLHFASLKNTGKRLSLLLLAELIITPVVVFSALYWVGGQPQDVSLLLAAIAIAGAPGTTVLVVQEARAKGTLTRTLVAAVGLIDMVAVAVFVLVSSILATDASGFVTAERAISTLGKEFGMATAIGVAWALIVLGFSRRLVGPAFVGPMMVAVILGSWGAASALGVSTILACTISGIAISNFRHETARTAQAYLKPFGGALFAGFYTLAGMRLDFSLVVPMAALVGLYFLARLAGKSFGSFLAMTASGSTSAVRKYLGIALMPHGGVAVGLILFIQEQPEFSHIGSIVAALGLATLAVNQLIGPSATRFSLGRTGEIGRDRPRLLDFLSEQRIVTELSCDTKEELIQTLTDRLYATSSMSISKEDYLKEVLAREEKESTCLGEGFMIPHAMLEEGDEIRGVLGLSSKGMSLGASDGRDVHAVLLLATPKNSSKRHLEILAAFAAAITRDKNLREQLYTSRTAAHAYDVIHADDSEDLNYYLEEAIQHNVLEKE